MRGFLKDILNIPELYEVQSTNKVEYSSTDGILDIQQVLKNKSKIFRRSAGMPEKSKKVLVFSDPMSAFWSSKKQRDVIKCLMFLSQSGFTIYSLGKDFRKFAHQTDVKYMFSNQNDRSDTLLTWSEKEIIQSTPDLRSLPRSKILFMDTLFIEKMLGTASIHYSASPTLELDASQFKRIYDEDVDYSFVLSRLREKHSGLDVVIRNVRNEIADHLNVTPKRKISEIYFPSHDCKISKELVSTDFANDGVMIGLSEDHSPSHIVTIRMIMKMTKIRHFGFDLPVLDLDLLRDLKGCKSLSFRQLKNLDGVYSAIKNWAADIEYLYLCVEEMNSDELTIILNACICLRKLHLHGITGSALRDISQSLPGMLERLEQLTISSSIISDDTLLKIFPPERQIPLETLKLRKVRVLYSKSDEGLCHGKFITESIFRYDGNKKILGFNLAQTQHDFLELKLKLPFDASLYADNQALVLENHKHGCESNIEILEASRNLKKLFLKMNTDLNMLVRRKIQPLMNLEVLQFDLWGYDSDPDHERLWAENLYEFLFLLPRLNALLILGRFPEVYWPDEVKAGLLSKLKILNISEFENCEKLLFGIMRVAPLEQINIRLRIGKTPKIINPIECPTLQHLEVKLDDFTDPAFSILINSSANIKTLRLDLRVMQPQFEKQLIPKATLAQLEQLTIIAEYSPSLGKVISTLLGKTSTLRELDIRISIDIRFWNGLPPDIFEDKLDLYPVLERFTFDFYTRYDNSGSRQVMMMPFLADLLQKSPALRVIKISGDIDPLFGSALASQGSFDTFIPEGMTFPSVEVLDISKSEFLNEKQLKWFIRKFPNLRLLLAESRSDLENAFESLQTPKNFQMIYPHAFRKKTVIAPLKKRSHDELTYGSNSDAHDLRETSEKRFQEDYPKFHQITGKTRLGNTDFTTVTPLTMPQPKQTVSPMPPLDETEIVNNPHDMNLKKTEKIFDAIAVFLDKKGQAVNAELYRITIFTHVKKNPGRFDKIGSAFQLYSDAPVIIDHPPIVYAEEPLKPLFDDLHEDSQSERLFLARYRIVFTHEFKPLNLPESPDNPIITHMYIPDYDPADYQVRYRQDTDQYEMRLSRKKNRVTHIEYIVRTPFPAVTPSRKLQSFVDQYASVINYEHETAGNALTADEWLKILVDTKGGACRHKVVGFHQELNDQLHAIRISKSGIHAVCEVKESSDSRWIRCDLGGYGSNVLRDSNYLFSEIQHPKSKKILLNPAFAQTEQLITLSPRMLAEHLLKDYMGKRVLVDLPSVQSIEAFQKLIRQISKKSGYPLYYIDSPEDINCHVGRLTAGGQVLTGEGGELYSLLTQKSILPPVILINWNRFRAEEIVQFNSLIDRKRMADGVEVPQNAIVIGLYNTRRSNAYTGSDFTSRRDKLFKPTFDAIQIEQELDIPESYDFPQEFISVYLHQSDDWRRLLCGTWKISTSGWQFYPGPFVKAIEERKGLRLHDAPWGERDFVNFIDKLRIEKMSEIGGVLYENLSDFKIEEGAPYSIQDNIGDKIKIYKLTESSTLPHPIKTLNAVTYNDFFTRYRVKGKSIQTIEGWLETIQNGEQLDVYLSGAITLSQWGQLIDALTHDKKLKIYCSSDTSLPFELLSVTHSESVQVHEKNDHPLKVFESQDSLSLLQLIKAERNNPVVIDCSGLDISDLFESIHLYPEAGPMCFEQMEGAVIQSLKNGREVILTGNLSHELLQYLIYWINESERVQGEIILLTERTLPFLKPVSQYIKRDVSLKLPASKMTYHEPIHSDMIQARTTVLLTALKDDPMVILTGSTGVGKTTFMLNHFARTSGVHLFHDFHDFDQWIKPPEGGEIKVLFIDEANISGDKKNEWCEFSGLKNNDPPEIIFNANLIKLTPSHKVVFAGNPKSYGGEREAAKLFTDYNLPEVLFEPISVNELSKKVLANLPGIDTLAQLIFLDMYDLVRSISPTQELITPRELEHMANLYLVHLNRIHSTKKYVLAEQCAYLVAKQVLPPIHHHRLPKYPGDILFNDTMKISGYKITQSRRSAESRLNEFLSIRALKMKSKLKGGLGGLIFEGEPGAGKSELMIAQLLALKFKENESFIKISSLKLSFDEKMTLLLDAYKKGMIVVDDEINSHPAFERFYNAAMQGNVPGIVDPKPGFLLLGTQNPISYDGRRDFSPAMRHRVFVEKFPPMPSSELEEILRGVYGLKAEISAKIVADFMLASEHASAPLPLRVLFQNIEAAKEYIESHSKNALPSSSAGSHLRPTTRGYFPSKFRNQNPDESKRDELKPKAPSQK